VWWSAGSRNAKERSNESKDERNVSFSLREFRANVISRNDYVIYADVRYGLAGPTVSEY